MHILLVDDERSFVNALAQRLELRGLHCTIATNADAALSALEQAPHIDLTFLDVNLPGMNGVELLRILHERYPNMDVIMLSGTTDLQIAVQAMKRGAVNWLPKPVDGEALLQECQRSKERQRQRRRDAQLAEVALMRSLGTVAEGVAHEVNNPVNIMTQAAGWVEDLLEDVIHHYQWPTDAIEKHIALPPDPPWEEMRKALRSIREQSLRVREITRRLLVFGKGMDAADAPIDVALVLHKAVEMLAGQAEQAKVHVVINLDPALPWPSGSAVELHQVFVHVLENALEAMPTGGHIHICSQIRQSTNVEDPTLILHFTNTGPAIALDVLPHIFEPFFSTKATGAGLGLAVCQSLLLRRRGTISATNSAQGPCFTLALPLES